MEIRFFHFKFIKYNYKFVPKSSKQSEGVGNMLKTNLYNSTAVVGAPEHDLKKSTE